MPQGLHEKPDQLRRELRMALERTEDSRGRRYDASVLGYGLCSNGIVGLSATIPFVVARGHDCITLLLGSKEKYRQYFDTHRGVYWYSAGWIEANNQPGKERYEQTLTEYRQKYGEENADYLMEVEQSWIQQYNLAAYIDWPLGNSARYRQYTRRCAEFMQWSYDEVKGDPSLMQQLLDGPWPDEQFLLVQPSQKIVENLTSEGIVAAEPIRIPRCASLNLPGSFAPRPGAPGRSAATACLVANADT